MDVSGTGVATPLETFCDKYPLLDVGSSVVLLDNIVIPIVNRGLAPITLHEHTHVATLELVTDDDIYMHSDTCSSVQSTTESDQTSNATLIDKFLTTECSHLSPSESSALRELLLQYSDCFSLHDQDTGYCDAAPHSINTGDAIPVKQHAYRLPFRHREQLQTLLDNLLVKNIIIPSNSPWSSPIVLVPKPNGSLRLCIDYRKLNKLTVPDAFPLPRIDETLDAFAGCQLFTTLDLATGYWQIAMSPEDQSKTAFVTPLGLFEFTVLPMGCCNGPATFQRLMECVLKDVAVPDTMCRAFFDDIGLGAKNFESALAGLKAVLNRLRQFNLRLKLQKCSFMKPKTKFLGIDISSEGIHTSQSKVEAIVNWPTPSNTREVRSFLGLANYYRKFVPHFSHIAAPLTALTKKDIRFSWSPACASSFRHLKERLASAPILALPDYSPDAATFILDVDASGTGIGGVLSQVQNGTERVLIYGSRLLSSAQRNYSATERELLAFIHFASEFRYYLLGRQFHVRTDHAALKWLQSLKEPRGRRARWLETLSEFDFTIEHRPGKVHANADALSRKAHALVTAATSTLPNSAIEPSPQPTVTPSHENSTTAQSHDPQSQQSSKPWHGQYTHEELTKAQRADPDLAVVLSWYNSDTESFSLPSENAVVRSSLAVRRFLLTLLALLCQMDYCFISLLLTCALG